MEIMKRQKEERTICFLAKRLRQNVSVFNAYLKKEHSEQKNRNRWRQIS